MTRDDATREPSDPTQPEWRTVEVPATLAGRINHLFTTVYPRSQGRPWSNDEVAELLKQRGGPTVSGTYLWQLRTGRRENPTMRHLEALAQFFTVPIAYFFKDDTAADVVSDLAILRRLRDAGVQSVALRDMSGLSKPSLDAVLTTIERMSELEGPGSAAARGQGEEGPSASESH